MSRPSASDPRRGLLARLLRRRPTLDRLRKQAARGDAAAQFAVGQAHLMGQGVPHSPALAVTWLTLAAKQGHAPAQHALSLIYLNGARAGGAASSWLALAETAASANATLLYPEGLNVPASHEKALAYAKAAAAQGLAVAQANLGMMYLRGMGCTQDFAEARRWLMAAADRGDTGGSLGLGLIHEHGLGVAVDAVEAAVHYRKAADAGNDAAMTALGQMHLDGRGVARDLDQARRLLTGPASRGNLFARKALTSLSAVMQPPAA